MDLDAEIKKLETMKTLYQEILTLREKIAKYDQPAHVCPPCAYPHGTISPFAGIYPRNETICFDNTSCCAGCVPTATIRLNV